MKRTDGFSVEPDGTRTLGYVVKAADAGLALIDCLSRLFPSYRRGDWLDAIASKALTVYGGTPTSDGVLVEGMSIEYRSPAAAEPVVDETYSILFEDEHLAIVNKSGNLPCHPAGRYYDHSLSRMLVARNGFPSAFMVNRIDRETSGLVLVAKTQEAASRCGHAMMAGKYTKQYRVLVEGEWSRTEVGVAQSVCGFIRLERGSVVRKKRVFVEGDGGGGQTAETIFTCLRKRGGLSLLEVEPVTGRPHQIRATLKAIGYPVVGDKLYGVDETIYARLCCDAITLDDITALRMTRQALHSWRLRFRHPFSEIDLSFEAPFPQGETLWHQ